MFVIVGGSQALLPFRVFNTRIPFADIYLLLTVYGATMLMLTKDPVVRKGKLFWQFIVLGLVVFWSAGYRALRGNALTIIRSELRPYLYLLLGYFLAVYLIRSKKPASWLLASIFLATSVASLLSIALYVLYLYIPSWSLTVVKVAGATVLRGDYLRATYMGADRFFMTVPLLAASLLLFGSSVFPNRLLMLFIVFPTIAMILTFTRGLWLPFMLGVLVLVVFMVRQKARRLFAFVGYVLIGCAIVIGILKMMPSESLSQQNVLNRLLSSLSSEADPTNIYRLNELSAVLKTLAEAPLLGYGLGGGEFTFWDPITLSETSVKGSHNSYLTIALKMGLIGLTSVLSLFLSMFALGGRDYIAAESTEEKGVVVGLLLALSTILVSSLVIFSISLYENMFFAGVCAGLLELMWKGGWRSNDNLKNRGSRS